jgi:hypothetical protein
MFYQFSTFICKFISAIFHPLLVLSIFFSIAISFRPELASPFYGQADWVFLLLIFITSYLFPIIVLLLLYFLKFTNSLWIDNQQDRVKSLLIIGVLFIINIYILNNKFQLSFSTLYLLFGYGFSLIVAGIISWFYKISLHSFGYAMLVIICGQFSRDIDSVLFFYWFLVTIILWGIVSSARLFLNKHSFKEVSLGSLVGLAMGIAIFNFIFCTI